MAGALALVAAAAIAHATPLVLDVLVNGVRTGIVQEFRLDGANLLVPRDDLEKIGTTDSDGKLFIPRLRSLSSNKISVDPASVPITADLDRTEVDIAPDERVGVRIDFPVRRNESMRLVLVTADGKPVPAGSRIRVLPQGRPTAVGFDGQAFLQGVGAATLIEVSGTMGTCRIELPKNGSAPDPLASHKLVCKP